MVKCRRLILGLLLASLAAIRSSADDKPATATVEKAAASIQTLSSDPGFKTFLETHCIACHDQQNKAAELALDRLGDVAAHNSAAWEKVVRKLASRQMPPRDEPRPSEKEYTASINWLASSLDNLAAKIPNAGRTESLRRLNRTEYKNTIRDLLGLDIDV